MKRKAAILRGVAGIMAFLFFLCTAAATLTFHYAGIINQALGVSTTQIIHSDDAVAADAVVYDNEYGTDPNNNQAALMLEMDVAAENIKQAEKGTVLLTNNGALPLAEGAGVTLFGNGAFHPIGTSTSTPFESIVASTLTSALQDALGAENVNATLGDTAYADLGTTSISSVVEAPIADVKAQESSWQSSCNDAAIVVLSRAGSESNDASLYNDDGNHYLGLSDNEADLMAYLQSQKEAGVFGSIIVLINSEQAMELDWLDDYGVDACMLVGRPGTVGYTGVVNLMVGAANPSGRVVDTYAANSLSAPAVTYAGNNTQQWTNLDWVGANDPDWGADGTSESNWILYAEGIYTGYKYYETRYEDTVLGAGNASSAAGFSTGGAWSYTDEVVFPFGYGLSYTTFTQTLDSVEYDPNTDSYLVEVTVTNTGDVAGMDVVEVYAQTPYGDYEKQNRVEKAAVQFVGMGKTGTLEPGASETVTVEVDRYFLASYDTYGAAGYILSAGDYYLAIGTSAHDALNNILAAKGFTTADGMDYDGDAAKTHTWNQAELDTESYPDSVEVTFTNTADSADTVVVTVEELSADHYNAVSDALTPGATYDITAVAHSENAYVTNPTSDTTQVAQGVTFAGHNVISANYYYTDGIARNSFSYPQYVDRFDLTNGGVFNCGNSSISFNFTATPTTASAGSAYTYSMTSDNRPFAIKNGTLELYTDGTFRFDQYSEMPPQGPSHIEGIWTDNGDGTANLSFDHSTLRTSLDPDY